MSEIIQLHDLKILPQYFNAIVKEGKNFEVRKNDRDFQVNDILRLHEWYDGDYSGRMIEARVSYILDSPIYCLKGFVIMAITDIKVYN